MSTRVLAISLVLLVPAAAGCMERSIKTTERRVLTAEETAEAEERAKSDRKTDARASAPAAPAPPKTPAEEIDRYREEIKKAPNEPKWHFLLGMTYEKLGESPKPGMGTAVANFELAALRYRQGQALIKDANAYTGPHFVLGRVLAKQQKWTQAIDELSRAVAVKPPDLEGYYLNPDYREGYWLIGLAHHELKNMGESEKAFREFLKYGGERNRVVQFFPHLIAE